MAHINPKIGRRTATTYPVCVLTVLSPSSLTPTSKPVKVLVMGKTTTPKYAMTMNCVGVRATDSCWCGRATEKRLREYLVTYNESLKPGGANEAVGKMFGGLAVATGGTIITNNHARTIVAKVTL